MKKNQYYQRRLKPRLGTSNTQEVTLPSQLLGMWNFFISGDTSIRGQIVTTKPYRTVLNSKYEQATVYMWINGKGNIEITNTLNGLKHVFGLHVKKELHVHGGSCVMSIHYEIIKAFKDRGIKLNWMKIFVNRYKNIELEPINKDNIRRTSHSP